MILVSPGAELPTPAYTPPGAPRLPLSTTFIAEPGDMSVQFRIGLYYGCSSRGPWPPDAARESWGSGADPIFLHEEQLVRPFLQSKLSLDPQEHPAEGPSSQLDSRAVIGERSRNRQMET